MKRWLVGFLLVGVVGIALAGEVSEPTFTFSDGSDVIGVRTYRARGQYPAPAKLNAEDSVGGIYGFGYGTSFESSPGVSVRMKANEQWSATSQGTRISFEATPNGAVSAREVFSFDGNGISSVSYSSSTIQMINWSSHTIVPTQSFVLLSSTGNMVMNSSLAASISTVSVPSGFRMVLLSTAARISIPTTIAGGESAKVYSSTGGAYINITTMTPVEFMWFNGFWRNTSELRP